VTIASETVTFAGSGLVFNNTYDASVTDAYRNGVLAAENFLQSHFSTSATLNVVFSRLPDDPSFIAENSFNQITVSYARFVGALQAHATTADDQLALAGLPQFDPTGGLGLTLPAPYAGVLGLGSPGAQLHVFLTDLALSDNKLIFDSVVHEVTEGGFGRLGSLGFDSTGWRPEDLFRFTASGQRDFTGGADGQATFFGLDAAHVSTLEFHSSISTHGVNDGQDLGDWDGAFGDSFGAGGPGVAGVVSPTDLRVLDILGWTPIAQAAPPAFAVDDFANGFSDTTHPFGQIAPGGSATGVIDGAGDRDWFEVQLKQGQLYTVSITGQTGGGGTLADPIFRLYDNFGSFRTFQDDTVPNSDLDAKLSFVAARTGTYFIEAGAFGDTGSGSYRVDLQPAMPTGALGGAGDDILTPASSAAPEADGGAGNDTIIGADFPDTLRGNEGNDLLSGGSEFDDINGNMGNDTEFGNDGDDWVVGGKDQDSLWGDNGADIVLGNLGNDTLDGGNGNDIVRGGQGDDVLTGGDGDDYVSGDRGNDTVTGGAGADLFHGSQDAGIDKVTDFNLAEGDRVMLDPGTVFSVRQAGADTIIDMGGSNQMILVGVNMSTLTGDWIFEG